jgi:hypothetical protein
VQFNQLVISQEQLERIREARRAVLKEGDEAGNVIETQEYVGDFREP